MPRHRLRKKPHMQAVMAGFLKQMQDLKNQKLSNREIGRQLGLSEATVRKRLKAGATSGQLGRFRRIFTPQQENELVQHAKNMDLRFYGLTLKSLRYLLFEYATQNNIPHRFNETCKLAGRDFTRDFMKKHRLSLRTPRQTSVARTMGFNKESVRTYFENLKGVIDKYQIPPNRIYNMDESGFQTVPNKQPKQVAPTSKREVAKNVSAERGKNLTVACAMNPMGHFLPPFFIFARKKVNHLLIKDAPFGSDMAVTDTSYMSTEKFPDFLNHFIKHTKPSVEDPVLLILDNHISHIAKVSVTYAKQNNIHMVSLPPHSSHKMQPLDKSFFGPMKHYYAEICDNWMSQHPGQVITEYYVAGFIKEAFEKSATLATATNAFRVTGIFPLDPSIFTDIDFLPASVTDQEDPSNAENHGIDTTDIDPDNETFIVFAEENVVPTQNEANSSSSSQQLEPEASTSSGSSQKIDLEAPTTSGGRLQMESRLGEASATSGSLQETELLASTNSRGVVAQPTENIPASAETSGTQEIPNIISPADLIPLPRTEVKRKRSSKSLKSTHLTGTPLQELEAAEEEKKRTLELKQNKKAARALFTNRKESKKSRPPSPSSSSEEDDDEVVLQDVGSSDESFSELLEPNDDDAISLAIGDFAIVKVFGKTIKSFRLYAAEVTGIENDGYHILFYK